MTVFSPQLAIPMLPVKAGGAVHIPASALALPFPTRPVPGTTAEWRFGGDATSLVDIHDPTAPLTLTPPAAPNGPTFGAISTTVATGQRYGLRSTVLEQLGQAVMCVAAYQVSGTPNFGNVLWGTQISNTATGGQLVFIFSGSGGFVPGIYANIRTAAGAATSKLLNAPALNPGDLVFVALTYDAEGWMACVNGQFTEGEDVLLPSTALNPIAFGNAYFNNGNYYTQTPTLNDGLIMPERLTEGELEAMYMFHKLQIASRGGTLA